METRFLASWLHWEALRCNVAARNKATFVNWLYWKLESLQLIYLNASRIPPGLDKWLAEQHHCILCYMSLVGSVWIVGMVDLFLSVGLVRLFGLVNLARQVVLVWELRSCLRDDTLWHALSTYLLFTFWYGSMVTFTCLVADSNCFCRDLFFVLATR